MGNANHCCDNENDARKRAIRERKTKIDNFLKEPKKKPAGPSYYNENSLSKELSQSLGDIITYENIK